jgi:transposase
LDSPSLLIFTAYLPNDLLSLQVDKDLLTASIASPTKYKPSLIVRECKGGRIVPIKERRREKRKAQQRRKEMPERKAYSSDLTDAQWEMLEPLIPARAEDATNVAYERREIVNGILYVLRSGCPWRLVPHDLPAWGTLYWYFRTWRDEGIWDQILQSLRQRVRQKQGREPEPSAAVIDSQSVKTSAVRGPEKGYDAGKKNLGPQTERSR